MYNNRFNVWRPIAGSVSLALIYSKCPVLSAQCYPWSSLCHCVNWYLYLHGCRTQASQLRTRLYRITYMALSNLIFPELFFQCITLRYTIHYLKVHYPLPWGMVSFVSPSLQITEKTYLGHGRHLFFLKNTFILHLGENRRQFLTVCQLILWFLHLSIFC